jgi:hypothetical protein
MGAASWKVKNGTASTTGAIDGRFPRLMRNAACHGGG